MSGLTVAALLAAIAFLVLVIFLCIFISRFTVMINEIKRITSLLTDDMHVILKQVEVLLHSTNDLMDDVNDKSRKLNPLITAISNLSIKLNNVFDRQHHSILSKIIKIFKNKKKDA